MRESYWWLLGSIFTIVVTCIAILFSSYIPADAIVVELLATLFGVLIAITLGEAFGANRNEMRAKWVEKELVSELVEILEVAQSDNIDEFHSPTWTATKGTGIPDRIEPRVRRALADAFAIFDIYNYEVRRYKEHSFTASPDDPRIENLRQHIGDTKKRLVSASQTVLEMVHS